VCACRCVCVCVCECVCVRLCVLGVGWSWVEGGVGLKKYIRAYSIAQTRADISTVWTHHPLNGGCLRERRIQGIVPHSGHRGRMALWLNNSVAE